MVFAELPAAPAPLFQRRFGGGYPAHFGVSRRRETQGSGSLMVARGRHGTGSDVVEVDA
jgi:hypothetical protein